MVGVNGAGRWEEEDTSVMERDEKDEKRRELTKQADEVKTQWFAEQRRKKKRWRNRRMQEEADRLHELEWAEAECHDVTHLEGQDHAHSSTRPHVKSENMTV